MAEEDFVGNEKWLLDDIEDLKADLEVAHCALKSALAELEFMRDASPMVGPMQLDVRKVRLGATIATVKNALGTE